jgi:hypothetical protein
MHSSMVARIRFSIWSRLLPGSFTMPKFFRHPATNLLWSFQRSPSALMRPDENARR